jgi:hypothetical protein
MAKKNYSKSTKEAARKYGASQGWIRLSNKRISEFVQLVKEAKGYVNTTALTEFAEITNRFSIIEETKMLEAARLWMNVNYPDSIELTKAILDEFDFEVRSSLNIPYPTSDDYFEFVYDLLSPLGKDELETVFDSADDGLQLFVSNEYGFSNTDVVDQLFYGNLIQATIIDLDGSVRYIGSDRIDFWDVFRELGGGTSFPIYNAYYERDDFGNTYLQIVIIGYY